MRVIEKYVAECVRFRMGMRRYTCSPKSICSVEELMVAMMRKVVAPESRIGVMSSRTKIVRAISKGRPSALRLDAVL